MNLYAFIASALFNNTVPPETANDIYERTGVGHVPSTDVSDIKEDCYNV